MRGLGLLLPFLATVLSGGAFETSSEYQVKAAFLFNLARFVEWAPAPESLEICVLGKNPFGVSLQDAFSSKGNFTLRDVESAQQAGSCRILFISSSERKRFSAILQDTKGKGILTVADSPGFAALGGVVNLILEDGRVHVEINPEAARGQQLRISSKLLGLAHIVRN